MAEVALTNVSKVYPPGVWALRDFSLRVADGELVVLVGPSGCGKTTTLRLLAGLEEPSAGELRIQGRVVNGVPPRQRDTALVFQKHTLYPHLNVKQNLEFGLRMKRGGWWFSRNRQDEELASRVEEAARLLEIDDLLARRPDQLSGGQQQRVALGRALVRQPAVYLLDEPLSHLDSQLRAETRRQLHLLQRRLRATMVYVTHDPVEAMTLADRVVVLDRGEMQQADTPAAIYRKPANRRVAGFFGWPPMNLLDGKLEAHDGRLCFVSANGAQFALTRGYSGVKAGMPATLGIRPEDVRLAGESDKMKQDGAPWTAGVVLIESLGGSQLLTLEQGGLRLTAKVDGRSWLVDGQQADVRLDMERAHLFDGVSGRAFPVEERFG